VSEHASFNACSATSYIESGSDRYGRDFARADSANWRVTRQEQFLNRRCRRTPRQDIWSVALQQRSRARCGIAFRIAVSLGPAAHWWPSQLFEFDAAPTFWRGCVFLAYDSVVVH
jgi:hypothetical protein